MLFRVEPTSTVPLYRQIVEQVRAAILSGRLHEGDALPSLRAVARDLVVNYLTVKQAYGELEREGLIQTFRGRGTFVIASPSDALRQQVSGDLQRRMDEVAAAGREAGLTKREFEQLARDAWSGARSRS
jgi:GntR family transcriptional regulator